MLPHHLYFLVVGTEIKKKVTKMTVYNVEKALFIYKIVTKTSKVSSSKPQSGDEIWFFFRHIFVCSGHTSKLEKKRKLKLCSSRASVVVATMRTSCIQNWIIVEFF